MVVGKAFPLAGAKVAGTPLTAGGSPATPPFRVRVRTGFAVTGRELEESLPAPVAENRDVQM